MSFELKLEAKCGSVRTAMNWISMIRLQAIQCDRTAPSFGGVENGVNGRDEG